jgi:peptide/nickel transport system permease protein
MDKHPAEEMGMISYIIRRVIYMIILIIIMSIVKFVIINIPPGDYLSTMIYNLQLQGQEVSEDQIAILRARYGLDLPIVGQYFKWFGGWLSGDWGTSFLYDQPVSKLIGDRIVLSMLLSLGSLIFTYAVAIPIGIYSATHQYSFADYMFTFLGFIGLATPNFLLALVLMFVVYKFFGWSMGGLFSPEYQIAPWSFGKFIDLLKHLPVPIIVVGTAGTAGMIRTWRGMLLDELQKNYVIAARAKGIREVRLLVKYPIRVAMAPMIAGIAGVLPGLISGATLTSIVISLPTVGPLLLQAIMAQDMYLAGSLAMFLSTLGLMGVLMSDLLLVVIDPRVKYYARQTQ